MAYDLGVDLGSRILTAAVASREAPARPSVVATLPAAVGSGARGRVLVGAGSVRDALARVGDEVPLVVDGRPWDAADVVATLVAALVARVAESEGGPADVVVLTRPACWGSHREQSLRRALGAVGLGHALLVPDVDAAVHSVPGVRPGEVVGVLDIGARTTRATAAVRSRGRRGLRLVEDGPLDAPEPVAVGAADVDDAVLAIVRAEIGEDALRDPGDGPDGDAGLRAALADLRGRCVEAKERLGTDTDAVVEVALPTRRTRVRIARADLESRVAPLVDRAVGLLRAAGEPGAAFDHVVLVGGTARMPLVVRAAATALGAPVHPVPDPATVMAVGAARAAARHSARRRAARGDDAAVPGAPGPVAPEPVASEPVASEPVAMEQVSPEPVAPEPVTADLATDGAAVTGPLHTGHAVRTGADVPRPPVGIAPVPVLVRTARAPERRGRLLLVATGVVLLVGVGAVTVPVPGLTRGTATSPVASVLPGGARSSAPPSPPAAPPVVPSPGAPNPAPDPAPNAAPAPAAPAPSPSPAPESTP